MTWQDIRDAVATVVMFALFAFGILVFMPLISGAAETTREEARATRNGSAVQPDVPGYFWAGQKPMPHDRLEGTVRAVLARLPHIPDTMEWRLLIIETAHAESNGGRFMVSWRSEGDLGVFQLQETTVVDTLDWLKVRHPDVLLAVMAFYDRKQTLAFNLEFNVPFGTALCATYYWRRDPLADISSPLSRAQLWKEQYNTEQGKGTVAAWFAAQK